MEDRKSKLLKQKEKIEERIKSDQAKLKIINQELENIEIREKADNADKILAELKDKGINDMDALLQYIKRGEINNNKVSNVAK